MPDFDGLSALIDRTLDELDQTKKSLALTLQFIEHKYRDGGRITERDYQEFLAELGKVK